MKNKESGHITENELEGLLKQAFLNLDFDANATSKKVLSVVSKQAMSGKSILDFFTSYRLNLFFFIFSFFVFLSSLYRYRNHSQISKNEIIPVKAQINSMEIKQAVHKSSVEKNNASKIESSKLRVERPIHQTKSTKSPKRKKNLLASEVKLNVDSSLIAGKAKAEFRATDSLLHLVRQDSMQGVEQLELSAAATKAKNIPAKSQKNVREPLPEVKAKVGRRSNSRKFRKEGTFRMKGGRYGKSKHPYHR